MAIQSMTTEEMTPAKQLEMKALLHGESLADWLFHGYAADLERCMHFIATGVPAQNGYVETGAAMQLITKRWSPTPPGSPVLQGGEEWSGLARGSPTRLRHLPFDRVGDIL